MFFYDAGSCFALFFKEIVAARAICEPENLEPVEFSDGQALIVTASFDYRKWTVDPYLEVGLAIAAVPRGAEPPADPMASLFGDSDQSHMGFYVVDPPVTTEQARAGGVKLWGYPQFTADSDFKLGAERFDGATHDPDGDGPINTLSGAAGVGATMPALSFVYFTRLNGETRRIRAVTRGDARYALPGPFRVQVSDASSHRVAKNMRALGLADAAPVAVMMGDDVQIRLTQGAPVP